MTYRCEAYLVKRLSFPIPHALRFTYDEQRSLSRSGC